MVTSSTITIEERLARIEQAIGKISGNLEQAPVMASIATDSLDELLSKAKNNGADVDQRMQDALSLLGRLSDPKITTALNNLLDFVEQAPGLISMLTDSVDEGLKKANSGKHPLDTRIASAVGLVDKISNPEMLAKIEDFMSLVDQGPGLMAMAMDSMDEFMRRNGDTVNDLLAFLQKDNLLLLKNAGDAFTEAQQEPPAKVGGLFGMLRTLRDPGRQKALGLLMNVLKNFGNKI